MDRSHRPPHRAPAAPQSGAIDPQELKRLERAFVRPPRAQAAVFWAIRRRDLSYADIAFLTGRTCAQVEILFADALYRLGRDVDEQKRGETISPLRRFVRERRRGLRVARLWRGRR